MKFSLTMKASGNIKITKTNKFSNRFKRVDSHNFNFVSDYIPKEVIKCVYCLTEEIEANLTTKLILRTKCIFLTDFKYKTHYYN